MRQAGVKLIGAPTSLFGAPRVAGRNRRQFAGARPAPSARQQAAGACVLTPATARTQRQSSSARSLSIRREGLHHIAIFNELHLRRALSSYRLITKAPASRLRG